MHRLFTRIFLGFLLAMVLIGAALVALTATFDPRRPAFARHQQRLERLGEELVAVYRAEGPPGLRARVEERRRNREPPAVLFHGADGPLSGVRIPPMARRLAAHAAGSGERQFRRTRHGLWLATPLPHDFVLVSQVPPPSSLERFLDPHRLGPRLAVVFLVAILVSYLLARSLSDPIQRLRHATRQLADGDLTVRVTPALGHRRDETAQLAADFDHMAERIESLVSSQQRLVRDVSHELRSPLARLRVALELARQKSGDDVRDSLDRIEREAERLNELVGQVLTLARLESGERPAGFEQVDLTRLVEDVCRDAEFEAGHRGRTLHTTIDKEVTVRGVSQLLHSAAENVVRNAVHFTAGGTAVEVGLRRISGSGGECAELSVRDHGPGVPEETLGDLFRPFYRVAEARDRTSGGTGIGLAITERAVQLHGGTVRAENAEGGGLRMVVELPLEDRAAER